MADYSKSTNFATKDSLLTGDPLKVIKGTEIDDEFEALETSIGTKADLASPTFTGTPKAPTAAAATDTTQLATTAFVKDVISSGGYVTSGGIADNNVTADELNVSGDGTSGQVLQSDGDGSFSWYTLPTTSTSSPLIDPSATDPTTRNDGSALQEGDIYYNTTDNQLKTYDGSTWSVSGGKYPLTAGGTVPVGGHICLEHIVDSTSAYSGDIMSSGNGRIGYQFTANSTTRQFRMWYSWYDANNSPVGFKRGSSYDTINYGTWVTLGLTDEYGGILALRVA